MGFDKNVDEIQGRILGMKTLPSTRKTFSQVRREENRKNVMLGAGMTSIIIKQNTALIVWALMPTQHIGKERESISVIIIENHIVFETIAEKFIKRIADLKITKSDKDKENRGNHVFINETVSTKKSCPFNKEHIETFHKIFLH